MKQKVEGTSKYLCNFNSHPYFLGKYMVAKKILNAEVILTLNRFYKRVMQYCQKKENNFHIWIFSGVLKAL